MLNINYKEHRIPGIYCITNTTDNKRYIGSSVQVYTRIKEHLRHLKRGKHSSIYFQRAYNKYGIDVFKTYVLEQCIRDDMTLRIAEKKWIDILKPEYNIQQDPVSKTCEPESRILISKRLKERYAKGEIPVQIPPGKSIGLTIYNFKEDVVGHYNSIREAQRNISEIKNASLKNNLRNKYYFCKGYIIVPDSLDFDECVASSLSYKGEKPLVKIEKNKEPILISKNDLSWSYNKLIIDHQGELILIDKRTYKTEANPNFYIVSLGYYRKNNIAQRLQKLWKSL